MSNVDVGARTIELNKAEYVIRGLGFIEQVEDIEKTVVKVTDNVPITIKDVANGQARSGTATRCLGQGGCRSRRRRVRRSLRLQSAGSHQECQEKDRRDFTGSAQQGRH